MSAISGIDIALWDLKGTLLCFLLTVFFITTPPTQILQFHYFVRRLIVRTLRLLARNGNMINNAGVASG